MIGKTICVDDTNFIFETQFSGIKARDRFGDSRRKANLLIPDPEQAKDLIKAGINVRQTNPGPRDDPNTFVPEFFVQVLLAYRDKIGNPLKYPPRVYLVSGDAPPVLLDEDSVGKTIDEDIRVKNVNIVLNPREYEPGKFTLYIRTMYVEQDLDDDPYAARYRARRDDGEELPF
jgi:hypothetical protein